MTTSEPCTTHSKRKRHYSTSLAADPHVPGRSGWTLCRHHGDDEERANHWLARWSDRRITVANLPECKQCAKAAARLAAESTEEA